MTESDRLNIERLLNDFSWCVDRGDAVGLSDLFTPDGVLGVGGLELRGRQQIADDLRRRFQTPGRKTRHVWSNLRIVSSGPDVATTTAIQLTFEQSGTATPTQLRVSDLFDTLQKDVEGTWRLARRLISRELSLAFTD